MTSAPLIPGVMAAGGAMRWRIDEAGRLLSDSGYIVTKAHVERGHMERRLEPIYRAFSPTGQFLGASGERIDAEQLCEKHKGKEDGFVITPVGGNEKR